MIKLKTDQQIEAMREAGRISAKALRKTSELVRPGISTYELNSFAENLIRMEGGVPVFLGYGGFKGSICSSVNDQIVHGIPSREAILREGDIISIDVGAVVGGWVGDTAGTYAVGEIDPEVQRLLTVTEQCMWDAIAAARIGNQLGDIGYAVQSLAEQEGFGVVREYVGHGVGRALHEEPSVPNYGRKGQGQKLKRGMVIAIEPMINMGSYKTRGPFEDGWAVYTEDGLPSAHFEKTIAITNDEAIILTAE